MGWIIPAAAEHFLFKLTLRLHGWIEAMTWCLWECPWNKCTFCNSSFKEWWFNKTITIMYVLFLYNWQDFCDYGAERRKIAWLLKFWLCSNERSLSCFSSNTVLWWRTTPVHSFYFWHLEANQKEGEMHMRWFIYNINMFKSLSFVLKNNLTVSIILHLYLLQMIFLLAVSRDKFLNLSGLVKWKVCFKMQSPKFNILEENR